MSLGTDRTLTILVCEDDDAIRPVLRRSLQRGGYTVLVASSGEEALALAQQHAGAIDLLITDLMMPGITGAELIERLTTTYPAMRALLMSGYAEDVAHSAEQKATKVAFLSKPFSLDDLTRKVRELLADKGGAAP